MAYKYRSLLQKHCTNRLPADVEKTVLHYYDKITADYNENTAVDVCCEAVTQWSQALASTANNENGVHVSNAPFVSIPKGREPLRADMPLSKVGQQIHDGIQKASQHHPGINENPRLRLKKAIETFNANLDRLGVQIKDRDGNLVDAVSKEELQSIKEQIPKCLEERKRTYSSFASNGYASKLKNGLVFEHCEF
jgi:hypothetical protein